VPDVTGRPHVQHSHRRHAIQVVASLPNESNDALIVLELARRLVSTFLQSDAAPARAQIVTLLRDDLSA
jgi:hypothetical protein